MKNAINYYYQLDIEDIHQNNKNYRFKSNNEEYIFSIYNDDISKIKEIYSIHLEILSRGLYCHEIVLNINNQPLTKIDGIDYILLKIRIQNRKINMEDVINFSQNYIVYKNGNIKDTLLNFWTNKVDYIEYQVNQFGIKFPLMSNSASYYIGLAETAISYLKNQNIATNIYSISHRRIKCNSTLVELYNPVNFIIDVQVRDLCEYLKSLYFEKKISIAESIKNLTFNPDDAIVFYSRLLFPTYYFDAIQESIDIGDESHLKKYINSVNEFQYELKNILLEFKRLYNLNDIEWILKT